MAKSRQYSVSLYPVEVRPTSLATRISLSSPAPQTAITASHLTDLLAQVAELGRQYGEPCEAYVGIADGGRKPAGFNRATSRLFYNIPERRAAG